MCILQLDAMLAQRQVIDSSFAIKVETPAFLNVDVLLKNEMSFLAAVHCTQHRQYDVTIMDPADLDAEQAEIEEDILKLQRHSIPLNLAWDTQDQEEDGKYTMLESSISQILAVDP